MRYYTEPKVLFSVTIDTNRTDVCLLGDKPMVGIPTLIVHTQNRCSINVRAATVFWENLYPEYIDHGIDRYLSVIPYISVAGLQVILSELPVAEKYGIGQLKDYLTKLLEKIDAKLNPLDTCAEFEKNLRQVVDELYHKYKTYRLTLKQVWPKSIHLDDLDEISESLGEIDIHVMVDLLISKNKDYGNSALMPPELLLNNSTYCRSITEAESVFIGLRTRMSDKVVRFRNLKDKPASNESRKDTGIDMFGYSLIYRVAGLMFGNK